MLDVRIFFVVSAVLGVLTFGTTGAQSQSMLSDRFAATHETGNNGGPYSASERVGREIWLFSTAGNARFHTYTFPQKLGASIDWYGVMNGEDRSKRFRKWGLINSPDCCTPGTDGCPATSYEETYGFDYCLGDDELLKFVGKTGYRDPACDLEDAPWNAESVHGAGDVRQSNCDLAFGTSAGALGFRKFPNPRFDREKWKTLNGSLASWEGFRQPLSSDPANADSRINRIMDGSVEPPFLFGMSCGACHIAFDPLNPPSDPAAPQWDNVKGLVGNQYLRISEILASGMPQSSVEFQIVARSRPGTVDTSAIPNDTVTNPGTMNAIINFGMRPLHDADVVRWHKVSSCPASDDRADERTCWCEPGKDGKCWQRKLMRERVPHILKGGEDSIGFNEAVQRVYFNIGSCAEQCFVNHIPDLRQADPEQRNYGQSPFDIGQCRRDCPNFRAIEDRLDDIVGFLVTARPTDLRDALNFSDERDFEIWLEERFGEGAVDRGRVVFAENCASCHSSQPGPFDANSDFHAVDPNDPTLRTDWLGNDEVTPVTEVGTHYARAMHSNHMTGRIWQEYGSETLRAKSPVADLSEIRDGGGRGYYRNISLLSTWAHAPYMHNNAIGPELCGGNLDPTDDFYVPSYVDGDGKPVSSDAPGCVAYNPSVEGRFDLFRASTDLLLNPDERTPKMTYLDRDVIVDLVPEVEVAGETYGFALRIPEGVPQSAIGTLRHKELLRDLTLALVGRLDDIPEHYKGLLTDEQISELKAELPTIANDLKANPTALVDILDTHWDFIAKYYTNSGARIENAGHRFGEGLSERDKKALTAFLATL